MAAPILIVLGSPNDEQGRLHSVALERCEAALRFHHEHPQWRLLLTGGYGPHFNTTNKPHAHYLHRWLLEHGAAPGAFLAFAESRNTLEDASLAKPIVLAAGATRIRVLTSDYHLARARFVFEREFAGSGVHLEFIGVVTDESRCTLDLAPLREHETAALARLRGTAGDRRGHRRPSC